MWMLVPLGDNDLIGWRASGEANLCLGAQLVEIVLIDPSEVVTLHQGSEEQEERGQGERFP